MDVYSKKGLYLILLNCPLKRNSAPSIQRSMDERVSLHVDSGIIIWEIRQGHLLAKGCNDSPVLWPVIKRSEVILPVTH